jgi:hypothetical protein
MFVKSLGCVCCRQLWPPQVPRQTIEFNHHLHAGKRIGNIVGTAECVWHHRSEPRFGFTKSHMLELYGPSRKYQGEKGAFAKRFGTDEELREKQAEMIRD